MAATAKKTDPYSVPVAPYAALIGNSNLKFAGVDQGIDFTGKGVLYALAPGEITRVSEGNTGWPGQGALIVEKLTGGPKSGASVYYAEDLTPAAGIAVGKVVKQGDPLAFATGSGQAPGVEVGFAQDSGVPLAPLPPPRPASQFTPEGQSFLSFVTGTNVSGGVERGNANAGILGTGLNQNAQSIGSTLSAGAQHIPGVVQGEALFNGLDSFYKWIGNTKNLQRIGEIIAGGALILVGVVMVGSAASKGKAVKETAAAAGTVAAPATRVVRRSSPAPAPPRKRAPAPRVSRPNTSGRPLAQSSPKARREAGFTLAADRKPKRGQPGSTRLARGDKVPF